MKLFKKIVQIFLILLLAFFLWYGIKLGDFVETRNNGSVLCLSCIGIE